MTTRMTSEHRHRLILETAVDLSKDGGLYDFNIEAVAKLALCSHPLVIHYFGSAIKLREAVINHALETKDDNILAQAIIKRDPLVDGLTFKKRETILLAAAG